MNEHLISLKSISKSFNGRSVLENVSLSINRGEITTLIGPNGAGKSTLLRIILGLVVPDRGTLDCSSELRVGYMPQRLNVDSTLPLSTLRFLRLANISPKACDEALALTGISHIKQS